MEAVEGKKLSVSAAALKFSAPLKTLDDRVKRKMQCSTNILFVFADAWLLRANAVGSDISGRTYPN